MEPDPSTDGQLPRLREAARAAPGDAAAWTRLAQALAAAGSDAEALQAADRALGLAPATVEALSARALALRRLGRAAESVAAWERAIALAPGAPELHAALAVALLHAGRAGDACARMRHAADLAPGREKLQRDAAAFHVQCGRAREMRALLERAVGDGAASAGFGPDARVALQVLDEDERLAAPLSDALAASDPLRLGAAITATPAALLGRDEALLGRLRRMAEAARPPSLPAAGGPAALAGAVPGTMPAAMHAAVPPAWPLIEAHFDAHAGDGLEALAASAKAVRSLAGLTGAERARALDVARGLAAVRLRDATAPTGDADAVGWECRVRFFHALKHVHDPRAYGGRFKALPNLVEANPREARGRPAEVVGTLRAWHAEVRPLAPPGPVLAALLMYLFAKLHPFVDGNGAMGRFFASEALAAAGWGPLIVPDALREPVNEAIRHAHRRDDLGPLVEALAQACDWRRELLARLADPGRLLD